MNNMSKRKVCQCGHSKDWHDSSGQCKEKDTSVDVHMGIPTTITYKCNCTEFRRDKTKERDKSNELFR